MHDECKLSIKSLSFCNNLPPKNKDQASSVISCYPSSSVIINTHSSSIVIYLSSTVFSIVTFPVFVAIFIGAVNV